jgi:thiol-disulfide isomerase/thioredoxin
MARRALLLLFAAVVAAAEPAPDSAAKALGGQKFANASFEGKVVLLQLRTIWCQYCRRKRPAVDTLAGEYAKSGLEVILAVNVDESRKRVKQCLSKSPRACDIVS